MDKFSESLGFGSERSHLNKHKLTESSTIGVELELVSPCPPLKDMSTQLLFEALLNSDYAKKGFATDGDFLKYLKNNKLEAYEELFRQIENMEFKPYPEYTNKVVYYWYKKIKPIIEKQGFKCAFLSDSMSDTWTVSKDGNDTIYNMPLLEIRTGILTLQDMQKFKNVLEGIKAIHEEYPKLLFAQGNSGLHVHVSNPRVKNDFFAKISAASHVDEDHIWDRSLHHDRDFNRHAKMIDQSGFENYKQTGAHDPIVDGLSWLMKEHGKNNTLWIDSDVFETEMKKHLNRNVGINIATEHPTVEYRYYSSFLAMENPQHVIDEIIYFVHHTTQTSNKDRVVFPFETKIGAGKFILTKFGDSIRIDLIPHENKYKIPRSNRNIDDSGEKTALDRPLQVPFSQWMKQKKPIERNNVKNAIRI